MSTAFTHLAAPSLEDTMEVSSSPAGNAFDNDIDIDFEDYGAAIHLTDDERMLEDGDPTRPPTATDEMMDDEDHSATVVEEVMQDQPHEQAAQLEPADEELIDYDDDSYQDVNQSFFDDTTLQNTEISFAASTEAVTESDVVFDEQAQLGDQALATTDAEAPTLHVPNHEDNHAEAEPAINLPSETATAASQADEHVKDGGEEVEAAAAFDDIPYEDVEAESDPKDGAAPQAEEDADAVHTLKAPPKLPGALDTTLSGEVPDGPPTPTDTGLLPMTVTYRDFSLPLFKSKKQLDGLLKNDNLASTGLSDLMQDCKRRLHAKLGETEAVPENHHIVLGFDRLGLVLVECDTSAYDISLNDIIQVWEQLHYNDDLDVPPLSVTLTSQPKFSSALGLLQEAVNQEQGIASLQGAAVSEHVEYVEDEQAVDSTDAHDAQLDDEYGNATGNEEQYKEHAEAFAEDYAEGFDEYPQGDSEEHQDGQEVEDEQTNEYEAEHHAGDGQPDLDYAEFNEDEEYPDPEEYDQEQDAQGKPDDACAAEVPDNAQADHHAEPAENGESGSAASSTTARDDAALDTAEADPNHGADELSAFLGEYEADAVEAEPQDQNAESASAETGYNDATNEDAALDPAEHEQEDHAADQPNAEESTAEPIQEQYQDDPDEGLIQYEDDTFNDADYVEHADQDDPDGNDLGDEEELFHTALDTLEGDETEHGQEDAADGSEHISNPQEEIPYEDEIGYEDDYPEPEPETKADATSKSPLGKRSFEDLADEDELDFDDEPEQKKARSD